MTEIWLDIETSARKTVTECGLYVHADDPDTDLLSLAYAIDHGPVHTYQENFAVPGEPYSTDEPPEELLQAIEDGALVWARNAAYERVVWNGIIRSHGWDDWPVLKIEQMRDSAVAAAYYNLPRNLEGNSNWLPVAQQKYKNKMFKSLWDKNITPLLNPEHEVLYSEMVDYNKQDVVSDRYCMGIIDRNLSEDLWLEYAASERINDLGMAVDRELAQAIVTLSKPLDLEVRRELHDITNTAVESPRGPKAREWTERRLVEEGVTSLFHKDHPGTLARAKKKQRTDGITGFKSEVRPTFDKDMRQNIREGVLEESNSDLDDVLDVLDLVDEGAQAAITKFKAAINRTSDDDPYLGGQYVFCGAGQTHRYSSHGMQIHNLLRTVPKSPEAFDELRRGFIGAAQAYHAETLDMVDKGLWRVPLTEIELVREVGITKAASMLLRPSFVAQDGHKLMWCDWSSIEGRGLPWLADSRGSKKKLALFEEGKDLYVETAKDIFDHPMDDPEDPIYKDYRQIGKVAELSLGFGGAVGAFAGMGRNYGLSLAIKQVKSIVTLWRERNAWAGVFWEQLMEAAENAVRNPGSIHEAGKVRYMYALELLGGTLMCELPDGNLLFYPAAKISKVSRFETDDDGEFEWGVTFQHPNYGRSSIWHGQLAENNTQAICASLLRNAICEIDAELRHQVDKQFDMVGHTHDEIIAEVLDDEDTIYRAQNVLIRNMMKKPRWAKGFPIACELSIGDRYYVADK